MITYPVVLRDADEIEQFFLDTTGMQPGYLQLSRGLADLRLRVVELPGVTLVWCRAGGKARWRDQMPGENLHIGFAVESSGPINACGHYIDADEAQVWMPGKEMDLILEGPNLTLEIGVDKDLVEELGWEFAGEPLSKVPSRELAKLIGICSRITDTTRALQTKPDDTQRDGLIALRDMVLESLEPVLKPWLQQPAGAKELSFTELPHYRLIRRADDFFDGSGLNSPFEVAELADALGVPRRTIFHAFRKQLGVGPRRYLEIKRLHALRARLRRSSCAEATVASLAADLGFADMGRMAANYRLHFGERPRDTLRYG